MSVLRAQHTAVIHIFLESVSRFLFWDVIIITVWNKRPSICFETTGQKKTLDTTPELALRIVNF